MPESKSNTLTLSYHTGDIFAAPPNALLIHACNTQGSWGAGIAAAFRTQYPESYKRYRAYCLSSHNPSTNPVRTGTCLLIPPCEAPGRKQHWIGCLFTSARYGKGKDRPNVILANTGPAMRELMQQFKEKSGEGEKEVRMCKINSARFGVPWERTVAVLEGIEVQEGWMEGVEVWSME
jgi:ADP-ribose 1''-phosphate phosphatase